MTASAFQRCCLPLSRNTWHATQRKVKKGTKLPKSTVPKQIGVVGMPSSCAQLTRNANKNGGAVIWGEGGKHGLNAVTSAGVNMSRGGETREHWVFLISFWDRIVLYFVSRYFVLSFETEKRVVVRDSARLCSRSALGWLGSELDMGLGLSFDLALGMTQAHWATLIRVSLARSSARPGSVRASTRYPTRLGSGRHSRLCSAQIGARLGSVRFGTRGFSRLDSKLGYLGSKLFWAWLEVRLGSAQASDRLGPQPDQLGSACLEAQLGWSWDSTRLCSARYWKLGSTKLRWLGMHRIVDFAIRLDTG